MNYSDYSELLDVFCWGLDFLAQPTLAKLLLGYEGQTHRRPSRRLIAQLRQRKLIAAQGRGRRARYTLTEQGRQRVWIADPDPHWRHFWDGAWRVVSFDLPETRRAERKRLWQALRAHRLGLLQRSVWIWPHDVADILHEIIRVEGVPDCFCAFKATEIFRCADADLVRAAWDWAEILSRQQAYLRHIPRLEAACRAVREPTRLGELARRERELHERAIRGDPWLPLALWPAGYQGHSVHQTHQRWHALLRDRVNRLA